MGGNGSGSGGPKAVVDKTPADQEEKRGKKHSEHPANSSLVGSEQDQGNASQIRG